VLDPERYTDGGWVARIGLSQNGELSVGQRDVRARQIAICDLSAVRPPVSAGDGGDSPLVKNGSNCDHVFVRSRARDGRRGGWRPMNGIPCIYIAMVAPGWPRRMDVSVWQVVRKRQLAEPFNVHPGQVGQSSETSVDILGLVRTGEKMLRRTKGGGLGQTSAERVEILLFALTLHGIPSFVIGFQLSTRRSSVTVGGCVHSFYRHGDNPGHRVGSSNPHTSSHPGCRQVDRQCSSETKRSAAGISFFP